MEFTTIKNENGKEICFEAAANIMDDELREGLHNDIAPCSEQEFFDTYCKRHLEKFGDEFAPNAINGNW